jgi:hypothetical protein
MVNAYRNKDARNLEVAVGNIQDYKPADKFDYVVCIGVLEYSGTFIDDPYPYKRFLELVRSFVCDGGTLLLAIENKFGLKYLSGTAEDHLGSTFTGINDYIGRNKIRTFSRTELIRLMEEAGFESPYFYYPHPDYKLPKVVYSDDYYPNEEIELPRQLLPAPGWGINREQVFSEMLAMNSIENLGIFPAIANSFLVEVKAQS